MSFSTRRTAADIRVRDVVVTEYELAVALMGPHHFDAVGLVSTAGGRDA